jgi:hypothetical protein
MRPDPIFILGAHKSGTSLLRALFDGINNHYVIPVETHCFQILNYWIRYPYRRQNPKKYNENDFRKLAMQRIQKANVNDDEYSDSITPNWFDEKIFYDFLSKELDKIKDRKKINSRHLIDSYFKSIYASTHNGKELDRNFKFVEKSVENTEFAVDLYKFYPNAKFIYIIRNPYSNIVSLRKYKSSNGYPYFDVVAKTLFQSYYFSYRNERLIENYKIIRYEDLVRDTENVIKGVCQFLNIPYDKKMTIPTKRGANWRGNSTSGEDFSGISDKRLEVWKTDIHPFEIGIVNELFFHTLERFKYDYIEASYKKYFHCKGEDFRKYFINRLFLAKAKSRV